MNETLNQYQKQAELIQLAKEVQAKKATNKANIVEQEKSVSVNPVVEDVDEEIDTDDFNNPTNEMTENTPEARIKVIPTSHFFFSRAFDTQTKLDLQRVSPAKERKRRSFESQCSQRTRL